MKILGVHIGHDSGAALVVNGKLVADIAEERLSRIKHYSGLPIRSIEYCLNYAGYSISDIDMIAVPTKFKMPELDYLFALDNSRLEGQSLKGRIIEWAKRLNKSMLSHPPIYLKQFPVGKKTQILHVEHHLAHAASAYYTSGIDGRCLVITCDGVGDNFSICLWQAENGKITQLKKFNSTGSLGWFYSNVTEALGWWHGDGEGKTMGLAPYGNFEKARGVLDRFYPKFENGELIEPHHYGTPYFWNEGGAFQWHFEDAVEIKKLIDKYGPEDIAAEAQRVLEEQVMNLIFPWLRKVNTKNLACAGGVFLNVKLNQRVWYSGELEKHWVFPNPGDSGLSAGAALYAYYQNNTMDQINKLQDLYLGPEYSDKEIEDILQLRNIKYDYVEDPEWFGAKKLAEGKIVAWFQGRMEAGPRALGSRSITMSAAKLENKDIINANVKYREAFRPFCPSILDDKKQEYLVNCREEPFMITSFDVVPEKRSKIPAVVHIDHTVRPQTVTKASNERYYQLIKNFGELTGEYVILNTSFNIKGEPIICHPREAIRCFYDSGLDLLIMGNYILEKNN
jgi:carbamoyltransferase